MAFTQKLINIAFTLANGQFEGGGNTANLEGLRISARIDGSGGQSMQNATAAIWGMPLTLMNQLSMIGNKFFNVSPQNTISIMAGDSPSNMQLAFKGIIKSAFADASSQPQVAFRVDAMPGAAADVMPGNSGGVSGGLDVAKKMNALATQAGWNFENFGVNITLNKQYLWGSVLGQIRHLARIAPCEFSVDRDTLRIWVTGQGPSSSVTIAPPDMIGYPTFSQSYVFVKTLFNPDFRLGNIVTVQSQLTAATGKWQINHVTHEIESNIPKGKWFSTISGMPFTAQDPSN